MISFMSPSADTAAYLYSDGVQDWQRLHFETEDRIVLVSSTRNTLLRVHTTSVHIDSAVNTDIVSQKLISTSPLGIQFTIRHSQVSLSI